MAAAQAPAAGGPVVEADPLRCWWRTDRASVRMGEPFEAVLTCAALETASTKVVVDRSRLDPTVFALPPFDVLGGASAVSDAVLAGADAAATGVRTGAEAGAGSRRPFVALVPDRHGTGTNVLMLAPPGVIDFCFGPASRSEHAGAAAAAGAAYVELGGPLDIDLDTPEDLARWLELGDAA